MGHGSSTRENGGQTGKVAVPEGGTEVESAANESSPPSRDDGGPAEFFGLSAYKSWLGSQPIGLGLYAWDVRRVGLRAE